MELLDTIAADATAIAVLCLALSPPSSTTRALVVCRGSAGARLKGNGSLRRVDDVDGHAVG